MKTTIQRAIRLLKKAETYLSTGIPSPLLSDEIKSFLGKQPVQSNTVTDEIMFAFIDWLYSARYSKYWGSDEPNNGKWYKSYSPPNRRQYYTLDQLFSFVMRDGLIKPLADDRDTDHAITGN